MSSNINIHDISKYKHFNDLYINKYRNVPIFHVLNPAPKIKLCFGDDGTVTFITDTTDQNDVYNN